MKPAAGVGLGAVLGAGIGGLMGGGVKGVLKGAAVGGGLATAGYATRGFHRGRKSLKTPYGGSRRLDPNTLDYDWASSDPRNALRNSSSRISEQMNSSGDIVLGMHNLRRG